MKKKPTADLTAKRDRNVAKVHAALATALTAIGNLIRLEPTCIRCGCTEYSPCDSGMGEGCSWIFVNKKTNEGLCSVCLDVINRLNTRKARR